ncbi:hypothetical protein BDK51DRAFT_45563 [Blyttiomyces helicus]|uniref:Uncharacterized protein n=1 Tax=Blyttiomyces helicus TaxID=388810 RepID=A0A4P9W569_9FUNG|nr:hypothetical protein BDK51DRAFT_45563 [Blyttiomyces helicus]|eukprot:RKO87092.1 hypothetical protein BDK51DRAFT_45563 [Blyttiomyces helicus]
MATLCSTGRKEHPVILTFSAEMASADAPPVDSLLSFFHNGLHDNMRSQRFVDDHSTCSICWPTLHAPSVKAPMDGGISKRSIRRCGLPTRLLPVVRPASRDGDMPAIIDDKPGGGQCFLFDQQEQEGLTITAVILRRPLDMLDPVLLCRSPERSGRDHGCLDILGRSDVSSSVTWSENSALSSKGQADWGFDSPMKGSVKHDLFFPPLPSRSGLDVAQVYLRRERWRRPVGEAEAAELSFRPLMVSWSQLAVDRRVQRVGAKNCRREWTLDGSSPRLGIVANMTVSPGEPSVLASFYGSVHTASEASTRDSCFTTTGGCPPSLRCPYWSRAR